MDKDKVVVSGGGRIHKIIGNSKSGRPLPSCKANFSSYVVRTREQAFENSFYSKCKKCFKHEENDNE